MAMAMRIAPGTVGSTLHAARRHLEELLRDPPDGDDDEQAKERSDARR
jgi:hypothetical protein